MSLRTGGRKDLDAWRAEGRAKTVECIAPPDIGVNPKVTVERKFEYDGLLVEELSWQLPCGRPTQAILLKPKDAKGRLPAILGLHDHGGQEYFGKRKSS